MFDAYRITEALRERIGWRNTNSPAKLTFDNIIARSGRHFQDFHSSVTLRNLYETMEAPNASDSEFNQFLHDMRESAILTSVNAILNEDSLMEQSLLFNRKGKRGTTVGYSLDGKRGYRIELAPDPSYCVILKTASLMFDQQGTVQLIVQHSTGAEVLRKEIEVTDENETVVEIDTVLRYSGDYYKGGYFFLYYESELTPVEFNCPDFNKTHLFSARPFQGSDLNNVTYTSNTYGLNLEVCAYRDFTTVIERSAHLFDTIIGLQMAADVIELILNSTRSNATERLTRLNTKDLYNDLNIAYSSPEFPYSTGIRNQISREIKRLKSNLLPRQKSFIQTPCFI